MPDVGTTSWVFEFLECNRWNRDCVISKRCSMKIREGKSIRIEVEKTLGGINTAFHKPCPMFLCDCISIAITLASSREIQCESHSVISSKADLRTSHTYLVTRKKETYSDRKSTRLNSSHLRTSRMPSSA